MNFNEFYKQHIYEWELTEQECKAIELAKRYFLETEAYDRTVCTGPIRDGSIMPANPHEAAQINRNAIRVRERIMSEAAAHGINRQDMARAISRVA